MEGEIESFIKVCLSIFVSLCYCYCVGQMVSKGIKRLAFVFPIVCLFLYLPLNLYSINCGGLTSFFISWLANFKLLLFAFGKGPLSLCSSNNDNNNNNASQVVSFGRFMVYACFPIDVQQNLSQEQSNGHQHVTKSHSKGQTNENPSLKVDQKWILIYSTKVLILAILVLYSPNYKAHMSEKVILFFYSLYVYLVLDILLAAMSFVARAIYKAELEPHFIEPYLATSLQDFWGKRWNLVVSRVLRPTVYEPSMRIWSRLVGRRWASIPSVMSTFVVSGLMHELIYYYLARVWPTWEVTWFFLIHGLCLTVEIALKKMLAGTDTWRLPRVMTGPLTVLLVMDTCFRLMFPQIIRCKADVRLLQEYAAIGAFCRNVIHKIPLLSVV